MSKTDIVDFFYRTNESLGGRQMLLTMCFGLCIAAVIFLTYKITYAGVAYSAKFNISNAVILLITIVIMLMISSNIIISLGMVGALSIVRFRTAIKDPRDTVFIFWSIAEGLCVGSQNFKLALISSFVIGIILVGANFFTKLSAKYLIIVKGDETLKANQVLEILKKHNRHVKLRASNSSGNSTDMVFEALLKKNSETDAAEHLRNTDGVHSVNILYENGENVG